MDYRKIAALCGLALSASAAAGAENLMLDEIVVKGKSEPPREESVTIREVRESPARDLGEAVRQVEGVDVVRKGAIANDIVLRGEQKDNINVLLDGVRIHGACPNRMDSPAFHIDFAEVEQIRIVKGPYDLTNPGSMGGLVDVTPKTPPKGFGGDVSVTYGSFDTVNASGTASYGGDKGDGLLGYAYKYSGVPESGNGRLITDIYPSSDANRYRPEAKDSTAYSIHTGWARLGYKPTENSRAELSYTRQDAEHVLYPYLLMDADYDRMHRVNGIYKVENLSGAVKEVKLQAYWDRVAHLMDNRLREISRGTPTNYTMLTDAVSQVYGTKLTTEMNVVGGTFRGGIDFYNRTWDATNIMFMMGNKTYQPMIPDVRVNDVGFFIEQEQPLSEQVKLKGGFRGDMTWVEARRLTDARVALFTSYYDSFPGRERRFEELTGNIQLTWKPVPEVEIFTGLARGARTPDPQELYINLKRPVGKPNWIGNPNLNATQNNEADLGVKYTGSSWYANLSLFYSDLHDYINVTRVTNDTQPTKTYENVNARMWGGELGSQVSLPDNLFFKLSLSYTQGENITGDRPLAEIPPFKGTFSLRYDDDTWLGEVAENFALRQDRVDPVLEEEPTGGWMTTDLKAGYRTGGLAVYAGINNLLDKQYYSHLSYQRDPFAAGYRVPETGRYFYVTATYRF